MELYAAVRRAVFVEGILQREAARRFGLSRMTVAKMMQFSIPPGYRRSRPPRRPKLEPYLGVIDQILDQDTHHPRKQRHTAWRLFERLREEYGYEGGYTTVKDYVRAKRLSGQEMFVPLSHPPGHAQADFGEAEVIIDGVRQKAHFFVMDLKQLRLPTFGREYDKVAQQCAQEDVDHPRYLLRLCELEMLDREHRATERRIRAARFSVLKSLDSFDFLAIPSLNKALVLELARCEYIGRKENVLALGNSGTGKTHIALGLGLAACQQGYRVRFTTAAALVHELIEAKDEKRLLRFQKHLAKHELLIVDELGFVPLSKSGAELLFEVLSQRYERSSTFITSNLPFNEWTEILGSERLTGALLDRLTHHVHILEMNGPSYRLKESKKSKNLTSKKASPVA